MIKSKKTKILVLAFLLTAFFLGGMLVAASRLHKENFYSEIWCKEMGGISEYRLSDKTRVDCLTPSVAVEVDFASKHYEAVGQALFYANMTAKKPGIALIMEDPVKEFRYLRRLLVSIQNIEGFSVWIISPQEGE